MDKPLDPAIEAAETDYGKRQAKRARLEGLTINVKTFKEHAEQSNECDTCGRSFSGSEKQEFLQRQVC